MLHDTLSHPTNPAQSTDLLHPLRVSKVKERSLHPPVHVFQVALGGARLSAQQDDDRVHLGRDEAQQEHVAAAAVVALQGSFSHRAVAVEGYLLALGPDKVVNDMTKKTK